MGKAGAWKHCLEGLEENININKEIFDDDDGVVMATLHHDIEDRIQFLHKTMRGIILMAKAHNTSSEASLVTPLIFIQIYAPFFLTRTFHTFVT